MMFPLAVANALARDAAFIDRKLNAIYMRQTDQRRNPFFPIL
jgi:hypothetical protein